MNARELFGVAGAVIVACSALYYVYDIVHGSTRPHRVSWAVWTCVGLLGFGAAGDAGAGAGAYVAGVYAATYVVTFTVSLMPRFGKAGVRSFDVILGVAALAGLMLWRFGELAPSAAAVVAIACDAAALWPTLREAWLQPESESLAAWTADVVGNALALFAVATASFAATAYPAYLLIGNVLVTCALATGRTHARAARRGARSLEAA